MIELTQQEIQNVIKDLAEIPAKYSYNLISFFSKKLQDVEKTEKSSDKKSTPN